MAYAYTAGAELQIDVQASDLRGDPLTYSLDLPSIDRGMTIDAVGRIRWQTDQDDITAPPHHTVTVMVSDGRYTIEDDFLLSVVDDTTPPDITLAASASGVNIDDFLDLTVLAIDDVGVVETTLTLYSIEDLAGNFTYPDEKLALTPQGMHRLTALTEHLGFLTFHATAKDAKNPEVSATPLVVQVFDPNDTTAPTVNLLPPDGVVTVPTDLLGTIEDDQSVTWTLTATPVDTELMGDWTRKIGEGGSGNVVPAGVVGRFDPTNLPNGSYVVTLEAKDGGGQTASDSEIVTVDGRLKLGNFSLSFNDLEIPVAGIPITVTRTYDTLDSQGSGDFGYGWNLQVVQPEMTLDYSTVYPGGAFINGTRITVTTPEGTEEGFTFKWIQVGDGLGGIGQSASWGPSFVPDPGNNYELVPPNLGYTFTRLTENGPYQVAGGTVLYSGQNPSFGGAYELKEIGPGTRGLIYTISAATMTGTRVTDKYGNGLRFSDTEIKSVRVDSEGKETPLGRDIAIERDFRGNIKTITDPNGFELRYEYDSRGRLVSFYDRCASDKLDKGVAAEPTRFEYRDSTFNGQPDEYANFLTAIVDPLGIAALQANYDPDTGRLESLTDAAGNPANLDYNLDELTVTSDSSSGSTEVTLDDHGNPIREVDEAGQVTLTTYHDPDRGLPASVTRVIGEVDTQAEIDAGTGDDLVTSYAYNQHGQRTSETDPRGNVSVTSYDFRTGYPVGEIDIYGNATTYGFFEGQLGSTFDADGNSSGFGYDEFGNVQTVNQSNSAAGTSTSTTFDYNEFGDLVGTTDPDFNERTILYNNTGNQTGTEFIWYETPRFAPVNPNQDLFGDGVPTPPQRILAGRRPPHDHRVRK